MNREILDAPPRPDEASGLDEFEPPIGTLVRIDGDASLFVVEQADGCAGCALDPDVFEAPPFPCSAFSCCRVGRADEKNVVLRRLTEGGAPEETR